MSVKFNGYDFIDGGICAAKGFKAFGVHCGLRKNKDKPDLALIFADKTCKAAGVYTQNKVKGAPLLITKEHLSNNRARAVIINSGNANTCNADGEQKAEMMCSLAAEELGIDSKDVLAASTGIIGETLPIEPIAEACPSLVKGISKEGHDEASQAILTTDTYKKEIAVTFSVGDKLCTIGGMAKGSGMIHPNMATMLCFISTDINIEEKLLKLALNSVTNDTFNMISVDGDTSTNDMVLILSSGAASNPLIQDINSKEYESFLNGLYAVMMNLSRMIAKDGEGATKLLECSVQGAANEKSAKTVAKSVITSNLFKSAMFGEDPNWGRILCAVGYADTEVNINGVEVMLMSENGKLCVCRNGRGVSFSPDEAKKILLADEIKIIINLQDGEGSAVAWGCDLTYDYVKINASYHT